MKNKPETSSKKNEYLFDIQEGKKVKISSKFESGNIRLVKQTSSLSVNPMNIIVYTGICLRCGRSSIQKVMVLL